MGNRDAPKIQMCESIGKGHPRHFRMKEEKNIAAKEHGGEKGISEIKNRRRQFPGASVSADKLPGEIGKVDRARNSRDFGVLSATAIYLILCCPLSAAISYEKHSSSHHEKHFLTPIEGKTPFHILIFRFGLGDFFFIFANSSPRNIPSAFGQGNLENAHNSCRNDLPAHVPEKKSVNSTETDRIIPILRLAQFYDVRF